jgi:dipeptidyl-peptidase-4
LIARVTWLPDSSAVAIMRLNRIQNNLDLMRADVSTGQADVLLHESDRFWINVVDEPYFLKNGKGFLWESERGEGGFRHFYFYGMDGKVKHQITKGNWVVERLMTVDEAGGRIFYMSNEGSPVESQLYEVDLNGKHETKLTSAAGVHGVSVSPQGAYFTDSWSNTTAPPSQTLRHGDGSELMVWMKPDTSIAEKYALSTPEIVEVPASNGDILYARMLKPVPFDPLKKYPVIVQVYGGPGVQTIRNQWSGLGQEQVFASAGYIVWSLDNHGSMGRGHAFESKIFRDMGRTELEDQKTGIAYLKKLSYVDGGRIGITGWSYGGYMTLYSLVNAPGLFKAGLSGAPVTDWRNYDSIYTERYMGLPQINADGYEHSSPKTHAGDLQAKLLILHNIEDDNVHFQNTMQMAEALEKSNKQFRMVVYPQKSHGVYGMYSKSLSETMLDFFDQNLKN